MIETLTALPVLAFQDVVNKATENAEVVEQANDAAGAGGFLGWLMFILVLAVVIGGGYFLANALKMTEWTMRFVICLAALMLGVMPFVTRLVSGEGVGSGFRLGIDLAGGTNMVFRVIDNDPAKPLTSDVMDKMVASVGRRINPSGTSEITVRQVGADRIEVIVPGKDAQTIADIKRRIVKLGSLEFFVPAHPTQDRQLIEKARALSDSEMELTRKNVNEDGEEVDQPYAKWVPAFQKEVNGKIVPQYLSKESINPQNEIGNAYTRDQLVIRKVKRPVQEGGQIRLMETEEYLCLVEPPQLQVTGRYLVDASPERSTQTGELMVSFRFNRRGGMFFGKLTNKYKPGAGRPTRRLGIVLDGMIYSAPRIQAVITTRGEITGDFTQQEVNELTSVLNAGALEVPIDKKPLSEATIDPTLGEDVRRKGVMAIGVASIVVVLFMLVYYRFAGVVAIFCLALNMLLVLTAMRACNATFTLPGLAGLVLTIGMAVDANVLIFERMREEMARGSSLRMCIKNGFSKAFTTIIDANVTTLITAAILFAIGTDTVKGFAVSLFIGIVFSMFTALYVGRLIFDVAERRGWIKQVGMMSLVGATNLQFLSKRRLCAVISVALILVGVGAFASRGDNNYDIDFTGGTMVTFQLTSQAETDNVRDALAEQFEKGTFTVERLALSGEDSAESRHFRLRTTESDSGTGDADAGDSAEQRVRQKVFAAFEKNENLNLLMVDMSFDKPATYTQSDDEPQYASFDGGQIVSIKFERETPDGNVPVELGAGTVFDMVEEALNSQEGVQEAGQLIAIQGDVRDGSGTQDVETFSSLKLRVKKDVDEATLVAALESLQEQQKKDPLLDEVNTFASAVASEMQTSAVMAILISLIAIVCYIWARFQQITFGLAAVVALVHDILIVLGVMALASYLSGNAIGDILLLNDFRINLPMVAAFLTIVGYSLNDTIVVFDRIREVRGKNPDLTTAIVDTSLNQTLSRTLLTSLTTFLVVAILYGIGGEGIHGFAFCLTIGVIVGTYSSIYVASPVLVWLMNRKSKAAA